MTSTAVGEMDKKKATQSFRAKAPELPCFPFITDEEMRALFGAEVAKAVVDLEALNQRDGICRRCGGKCCAEMQCELYAAAYGECPVYSHRPLLCRLNYCAKFGDEHKSWALALRDVGVEAVSLLEADEPLAAAIEVNVLLYGACRALHEPAPAPILRLREALSQSNGTAITRQDIETALREAVKEAELAPNHTGEVS